MESNAARAFYVERPSDWSVTVEEMHINYWLQSLKHLMIDVGLMLDVPSDELVKQGRLQIKCGLQIAANVDPAASLDLQIAEDDVARWLFNDNLELSKLPKNGNAAHAATAITKSGGDSFLLFPGTATITGANRDSCVVALELDSATEASRKAFVGKKERVRVYTRFQYRGSADGKDGYRTNTGILRDHILLDGRFSDIRGMPPGIAQDGFLAVKVLRVFLIHSLEFRVALQPGRSKQYERLLEKGQMALKKYFEPAFAQSGAALIHQWKFENSSGGTSTDAGHNVLLILDCHKGISDKAIAACILLVLAGGLLWSLGHRSLNEAVRSAGDGLTALMIAVALGIAGDLIFRWARSFGRRNGA